MTDAASTGRVAAARAGGRLGRYEVLAELGRDALGDIVLARRGPPARLSWLRVISPALCRHRGVSEALLDDVRRLMRVRSPAIAAIDDVAVIGGACAIASEPLPGATLIELIQGRAPLDVYGVAQIVADAARGLAALHGLVSAAGRPIALIHGGLGPDAIRLTFDGQVKLTDLGLARALARVPLAERPSWPPAGYAAPEAVDGATGARSDIFSLGILLWESLARVRLFGDGAVRPAPPPSSVRPEVPFALDQVCARALGIDPMTRFEDVAGMAAALEVVLTDAGYHREALGRYMATHQGERAAAYAAVAGDAGRAVPAAGGTPAGVSARAAGRVPPPGGAPRTGAPPPDDGDTLVAPNDQLAARIAADARETPTPTLVGPPPVSTPTPPPIDPGAAGEPSTSVGTSPGIGAATLVEPSIGGLATGVAPTFVAPPTPMASVPAAGRPTASPPGSAPFAGGAVARGKPQGPRSSAPTPPLPAAGRGAPTTGAPSVATPPSAPSAAPAPAAPPASSPIPLTAAPIAAAAPSGPMATAAPTAAPGAVDPAVELSRSIRLLPLRAPPSWRDTGPLPSGRPGDAAHADAAPAARAAHDDDEGESTFTDVDPSQSDPPAQPAQPARAPPIASAPRDLTAVGAPRDRRRRAALVIGTTAAAVILLAVLVSNLAGDDAPASDEPTVAAREPGSTAAPAPASTTSNDPPSPGAPAREPPEVAPPADEPPAREPRRRATDEAPTGSAPPRRAAPEEPEPPRRSRAAASPSAARASRPEPSPRAAPDDLYRAGAQLYLASDLDGARKKFVAALAVRSDYAPARRGLGLVYERTGQRSKAIRELRTYLRLAPRAADAAAIRDRLDRLESPP